MISKQCVKHNVAPLDEEELLVVNRASYQQLLIDPSKKFTKYELNKKEEDKLSNLITSIIGRQSQAKKAQISYKIWQEILIKSPNDELVIGYLNLYGGKIKRTFVPHYAMKLDATSMYPSSMLYI